MIVERSTEGSIGTDRLTDGRIEGGAEDKWGVDENDPERQPGTRREE